MILSALTDYYNRLLDQEVEDVAHFGYSYENISYALVISATGQLLDIHDRRDHSLKKPRPFRLRVPQQPEQRTSNIKPNMLWDKTSYALGVSAKPTPRTAQEHQAFVDYHRTLLEQEDDPGLKALAAFLERWSPNQRKAVDLPSEMLDTNVVFRLDSEKGYIHESPAAQALIERIFEVETTNEGRCLITGTIGPVSRTHPLIKGVKGAQSSGASIVSFNLPSSTSYLKTQGENAPVSEKAVFAYTTALKYLLRPSEHNRQRLQIGDTTVVFWAQADSDTTAAQAQSLFAQLLSPPDDKSEAAKLRSTLDALRKGQRLNANLDPDTRIFILGLAPNASRLSVRFWETGTLDHFAQRLAQHFEDLRLDPAAWTVEPVIWRLLFETTPYRGEGAKRKADDVQPHLAGELTRAILSGSRYPRSLLANLIMRMRADGDISSLRTALCKAILVRDKRKGFIGNQQEVPVSLDTNNTEPGYLLGRLFAALENTQRAALGQQVNATIRDRYYGAASATPASIFPVLIRNGQHHLSRLRRDKPGLAHKLEATLETIVDQLGPQFPRSLNIESQGRFAIGYYHQRQAHFTKESSEEGEEA